MAYPTYDGGSGLPGVGGKGLADTEPPLTDTPEHSGLPVFLEGNFLSFQSGWARPTAAASLKTVATQRDSSRPDRSAFRGNGGVGEGRIT